MTGGLIEHWDGNAWSLVNGAGGALYGVAAVSPGDAWQVGDHAGLALIGRWNGSTWEVSPSPSLAGRLFAATAITAGDVWAVGQRHVSGVGLRTLSEHFVCSVELYCFCGAGGGCPNPDPGAGCANSTGSGASLFHPSGSTSVALDDLVLGAAELPPNQLGIFLMGGAQASLPFSDGRLCVGAGSAGVFRYPRQSSGTSGAMTLGPGIVARRRSRSPAGSRPEAPGTSRPGTATRPCRAERGPT
ncbi:MAG TPA: hypothetical protein VMS76_14880 [Planctomycetota bacterium]|nr:hypothetical protein [Planctomycetota bacterium]